MRKRFSLSSWMAAGMLALGVGGFLGQEANAADTKDPTSGNLAAGVYGDKLSVNANLMPGSNPDPGMNNRVEDIYQFTGTDFTIGADGGRTEFVWKTTFGERDKGDDITMNIVGGTNIFDNQGIYIGSRAANGAVGGTTNLNISGGTNVFTQRVIVGSEGKGDQGVAGKSVINISGGTNIFTYDKSGRFNQELPLATNTYKVSDVLGENYKKYLGNGHYDGDGKGGATDDGAYATLNEYHYYNNYYGVFFSSISSGSGRNGQNTEGVTLTIDGGKNIFNVATYIGGGYDLNPYGSVNGSSDDEDVVWGGTNLVNINGGFTNFAARTHFGAAASDTTVNFNGRGTTYFTGTQISEDLDRPLAMMNLEVPGSNPRFENQYMGGDLPYVFFGGKDLTQMDSLVYNGNAPAEQQSNTVVNINGFNKNMTTVEFQTTAFFGGADELWLAGDQWRWSTTDIDENGEVVEVAPYKDNAFYFGRDDGPREFGENATRQDKGRATVNLNSGKMRLGYVNQTAIVAERNKNNWNYGDLDGVSTGDSQDKVYEPTLYQKRYEQIRLIGAAEGSSFNATGEGRIEFETVVHAEQRDTITAATDFLYDPKGNAVAGNGYIGYFADMDEIVTVDGQNYMTLETGMIAFDKITIGQNTDITLNKIGNIMARNDEIAALAGDTPIVNREFYTNAVFVDTTNVNADDTAVDLTISREGTDSVFERTTYNKWFYTMELEDVDANFAKTVGIQTNQVRFHVTMKDLDEALVGNMGGENADTMKELLINGEQLNKPVYDAVEQIISTSETAEEAGANMDQLVGGIYADMAANQVRRMSSFNTMLADQIIASDICLKNLRKNSYGACTGDCGGQGCGQCNACRSCQWTAWGHFYADGGKVDSHKNLDGYETDNYGAMFAIDWSNCESCHFGMFFNYSDMNVASDAPMGYSSVDAENYGIGLYAKWLGLWCTGGYGQLIASVNWTDMESNRELYLDDFFAGESSGVMPSLFYERGWIFFPHDKLSINPYFGLQYVYYHSEDFTEQGYDEVGDPSKLALNVGEIDHHSLRTLVGLRISRDWMLGSCHDRRLTTRFKGAWMHDLLGACDPSFTTSHVGNPDFPVWNVRGNNAGRDWAILGLGADFNATERLSFLVDYNIFFNEHTTIHTGMATVRLSF
ncbi:MAG: autotransporter outer membrane beta-barrel domain-containing protein [Planctomycetia bacterium]|nr:autotransporter outer membrane beta-barrel domain-containing protein [Planctomycetia bacterium]